MSTQNLTQTITASKHPAGVIKIRHAPMNVRRRRDSNRVELSDWLRNAQAYWEARHSLDFPGYEVLDEVMGYDSTLGYNLLFTKNPDSESQSQFRELKPPSAKARQDVMDNVAVIEQKFGRDRAGCMTLTCPGSSDRAVLAYAKHHPEIIKGFRDWMVYQLSLFQSKLWETHVLEFQGRGALHTHWAIGFPVGVNMDEFTADARREYKRILDRISDREGIDLYERWSGDSWRNRWAEIADVALDLKPIRKSLVHYFAKYLSKGAIANSTAIGREFLPTPDRFRWWGGSRVVASARKEAIEHRIISRVHVDVVQECVTEITVESSEVGAHVEFINNPYAGECCGINIYPGEGQQEEIWGIISTCFYGYFGINGDIVIRGVSQSKKEWADVFERKRVREKAERDSGDGRVSNLYQQEMLAALRSQWCSMPSVRIGRIPGIRIPSISDSGANAIEWRVFEYRRGAPSRILVSRRRVEKADAGITTVAVSGPSSIHKGNERVPSELQLCV